MRLFCLSWRRPPTAGTQVRVAGGAAHLDHLAVGAREVRLKVLEKEEKESDILCNLVSQNLILGRGKTASDGKKKIESTP